MGLGFEVWGSGAGGWGLRVGVWGWGSGFRVGISGFGNRGVVLWFGLRGFEFRACVRGLGGGFEGFGAKGPW